MVENRGHLHLSQMVFSGINSDGPVAYYCSIFWVTSSREETVTSTSLVRIRACPVVADVCLTLPAPFGLLVDVPPKVFLHMTRVDATGQMT